MRRPSKVIAVTPAAIEFEKRAIEREKKGQFRIAAHLWLQCMDVASGDVERARIAVRRDQCITKGNGLRRGDYSGIGCCRSEERRVGKECRIGCRSRWSPYH